MRVFIEKPALFTLKQVIGGVDQFDTDRVTITSGTVIKRMGGEEMYIFDHANYTALLITDTGNDRIVKVYKYDDMRNWVGFNADLFHVIGESSMSLVEVIR